MQSAGYCVAFANTAAEATEYVIAFVPDVIVLEADTHDGPPLATFAYLRFVSFVPTLLTGLVGSELERIAALDFGFDDVVPNPSSPAELVARVRAVLRRPRVPSGENGVVRIGAIAIDERGGRASVCGRSIELTALELKLLTYFVHHPHEVLSRGHLLEHVWGYTVGGGATVTVHVRRLREKIEPWPATPTLIRTVWGSGYRFDPSLTGPA